MPVNIYTHPYLRADQITSIVDKNTPWYNPFSLNISCLHPKHFDKQIRLFTDNIKDGGSAVYWLPESGLNETYKLHWITDCFRNNFVKNKNIHIATDCQDIYGWLSACCCLGFLDNKQVKIIWDVDITEYKGNTFRPKYWPNELLRHFTWSRIVLFPESTKGNPMEEFNDILNFD